MTKPAVSSIQLGAFKLPSVLQLSSLPPFDWVEITAAGATIEGLQRFNMLLRWSGKVVLQQTIWLNPASNEIGPAEEAKFLRYFMQTNSDGWNMLQCLIRFFPRG